jgi:hypothetical protein
MTDITTTERAARKSPSRFANKVTHKTGPVPHGAIRPVYETPEGAISFMPSNLTSEGRERTIDAAPPISLPRVAWLERPEVCPEIRGVV